MNRHGSPMRRSAHMKFKRAVPVLCAGVAMTLGAAACGGSDKSSDKATATATQASTTSGEANAQGGAGDVKIAFSAPAADHGWTKAVSDNAKAKAKELGLDMTINDSATTSAE